MGKEVKDSSEEIISLDRFLDDSPKTTQKESSYFPEKNKIPEKKNIFLLWFFSTLTLSIYNAFWYMNRSDEFENLDTRKKLRKTIPFIFMIIEFVMIISFITLFLNLNPEEVGTFAQNITTIQIVLIILFGSSTILKYVFTIYLAFRSRSIINEALKNKNVKTKISSLFTLIFGFLYLQYEINRIEKDEEERPRIGAWVFFVILILIIAFGILYSYVL
jgi:hypothetical protein